MDKIRKFIKPATKGLIIRDPVDKTILPETGDYKPLNRYWKRRLNDGSVVFATKEIFEEKAEKPTYENKVEKTKPLNKSIKKGA